jgi:pyruvate,water dikinase
VNHIHWLSQIKQSERALVGDKLFAISQLLQHGCPIMPGFILDNSWLQRFGQNLVGVVSGVSRNADRPIISPRSISEIGNLPDFPLHLDVDDYRVLQSVARQSRQIIEQTNFPQSWQDEIFQSAQQLHSETLILYPYLAIPYQQYRGNQGLWRSQTCWLTPEGLSLAIKRIWAELFTAKSLFYWQRLGIAIDQVNLAILIRPLKSVKTSGYLEINTDFIKIKANPGLQMSLERGEVQPDEYILNRETGTVLEQKLGHKSYSYRISKNRRDRDDLFDCLEGYILDFHRSESHSLNLEEIGKLIESTKNILKYHPHLKYLKWNLQQTASKTQIYFTDLDYLLPLFSSTKYQPSSQLIQPLLIGLGASPGTITAPLIIIENLDTDSPEIPLGHILVTKNVPPHQISLLKKLEGIITEQGGMTSHAAIIARELGIPAVVNAVDAIKTLQEVSEIYLNGDTGEIYQPSEHQQLLSKTSTSSSSIADYPTATKLMVNLSQPEAIAEAVKLPVDGVGLLRSELMLSELLAFQSLVQWRQKSQQVIFLNTLTDLLRQFASAFAPRPVFYRSIDWYAKENEINAIIGDRGTYSYLTDPTLFDLELQALQNLTTEGYNNLNLILPFVRSVEEFQFCRRRVIDAGLTNNPSFQLWIMAEVPSVILLLPEYIRAGVQGIAIGTNDLTQLLLGVNREQSHFANHGLDADHPAMKLAIAKLITIAKEHHIPCSLCGQAPVQYPHLIDRLVEWGITSISVESEAVSKTLAAIARAEQRLLLDSLR